ncbi:VIER F-box protein 2 [Tanacetum coccineum]|uniref:VIER F-box protein 2 n=1 Tax=Tanacetum coccineum TaxID=301880 RepID=A0ABQ5BD37_9ASTR
MTKASASQAWLWHPHLSHLNFDTINLLSKYDIVTGHLKLKFFKDHLCSSCELGKAKHKSFKTKKTSSFKRQLQILHMDLCGPMRVESINGKKYVLVIVDDYKRYTWTHFLRSQDETPEVLIDFLRLIPILKTHTPYPARKIRRIRACTHQRPQKDKAQYAVSRGLNTPYSRYGINIIFWKISSVVPTLRNPQYALNMAYPLPLDTAYPVLCPIQRIQPNRLIRLRMTKVIKGEFEKIKDIKVEDDSLACDSPLEVFNCEVSRLSKMDDDLFTYEVEIANIPCDLRVDDDSEHEADDMGFDPSDIAFTEWLGSKFFNYKTMDHYTMKALWIYWIRGDDEVELTDEEFSDNEDEIAEVFRIDTNIFDYETPICSAFNEFNYLLKVDPDLLTKDIMGFKTYDDYKDDWIYE